MNDAGHVYSAFITCYNSTMISCGFKVYVTKDVPELAAERVGQSGGRGTAAQQP